MRVIEVTYKDSASQLACYTLRFEIDGSKIEVFLDDEPKDVSKHPSYLFNVLTSLNVLKGRMASLFKRSEWEQPDD